MVLGIHHVTALASYPQPNVDFYVGLLGLRLVKQTVNFDDPGTYHLYYGDGIGTPGTLLTFFPYGNILKGKRGKGETQSITFEVPTGSLDWWVTRLSIENIENGEEIIFGKRVVWALDPDGMTVEFEESDSVTPNTYWTGSTVPFDKAIRAIKRVTLGPSDGHGIGEFKTTEEALTKMLGVEPTGLDGKRERFQFGTSEVDVLRDEFLPRAQSSAGTIHHVAFRNASKEIQREWLKKLTEKGFHSSPVMDREYFESIYFREPGGVLFEFATDGPGFLINEPVDTLGTELRLPPQYESKKTQLEAILPKLNLDFTRVTV
jgi:glyoxalase family protein